MLLAAIIAVASTTSVNLLISRVKDSMVAESSALLAGDLAVVTRDPAPLKYPARAQDLGLALAQTITLRSVIAYGEQLQLVRLKAVDDNYPLRGELQIALKPFAEVASSPDGPLRGEVWADLRLFQLLDLKPGDQLTIGRSTLTLSQLLVLEPDRGGDLFAFAPRVMMHLDDLAGAGLLVPGSRATYTMLVAGRSPLLQRFRDGLDLEPGHTLLDPRASRPEMKNAFVQAERFLTLAAFVGVLLATIGIALAAGAYSEHHESTVAIFKTLGLSGRDIGLMLAIEILLLALVATLLGDAIALAVHQLLIVQYMPAGAIEEASVPLLPMLHGAWVATIVLAGFALPTLIRLTRLPVTAVFSRDRASIVPRAALSVVIMAAATALIAPWHLGNPQLVAVTFGGMITSALVLAAVAFGGVRLLGGLRMRSAIGWRFGLANIARRARLSVVQTTALGLGIAVILLLALVRNDLLGQWRDRLPPEAPNHFLINVQADEVDLMRDFLAEHVTSEIRFYPMVRGRLTGINDAVVDGQTYLEPRALRLAEREFNLSWAQRLKVDNRVTAGSWWDQAAQAQLSVEEGIAETLGIKLGDKLSFKVADRIISAQVTSFRHVDWDNFEVNFFVVATPELLADAPATYITSFYLDPKSRKLMPELVRRFPSATVIDVDALMGQVRQVMNRVSGALSWVFGFALLAGVLVLAAAVQASQRERVLDVILLKTLGASRRFITTTVLVEFALVGALAGLLGGLGATGTGWLLAHFVLDIAYRPEAYVLLVGIGGGIVGVTLLGSFVVVQTHRKSVVAGLREAA